MSGVSWVDSQHIGDDHGRGRGRVERRRAGVVRARRRVRPARRQGPAAARREAGEVRRGCQVSAVSPS